METINTKYFHATTIIPRNWNKIEALRDNQNQLGLDEKGSWDHACNYFRKLHSADIAQPAELPIKGCFHTLSEADMRKILHLFKAGEVHQALFAVNPLKAPGLDGYHAIFFQKLWDTVGD
uniref:Sulfate transporter n=1 Tax=Rhizophora mucronata TaxID=61149 RepID=A0A2P2IUW9_RHIMU